MGIVEDVWNRIYLEFEIKNVIEIERDINGPWARGFGNLTYVSKMLDIIETNILKKCNKKNMLSFFSNEYLKEYNGLQLNPVYYNMDYVFRNNEFEKEKINDILIILILNSVGALMSEYPYEEQIALNFINEINDVLHKYNKKFIKGEIISVETELQEQNINLVLTSLDNAIYVAVKKEYKDALKAYEEYRFKSSITECNSAFESMLKCTCSIHGIETTENTVSKLIKVLKDNNYFEEYTYLVTNINYLSGILDSGVNTIRNKDAAHGGGLEINDPDKNLTKLALDLTTSYILFLAKLNEK